MRGVGVPADAFPPPCRSARKEYIVAKYMERRYVQRGGRNEPHRLWDAIRTRDLLALLQAFAEGHDLAKPLVTPEGQVSPPGAPPRGIRSAWGVFWGPWAQLWSPTPLAGRGRAGAARGRALRRQIVPAAGGLHHPKRVRPAGVVPLVVSRWCPRGARVSPRGWGAVLAFFGAVAAAHRGTLDRVTQDGNTALHYGALYNQPNCLKLLLKGKAAFTAGTGTRFRAGRKGGGLGAEPCPRGAAGICPHPSLVQ